MGFMSIKQPEREYESTHTVMMFLMTLLQGTPWLTFSRKECAVRTDGTVLRSAMSREQHIAEKQALSYTSST